MMSGKRATRLISAAAWVPVAVLAILILTPWFDPSPYDTVTILLAMALIPTLSFFLRYGRVRWWKYREGRNMIGITGLLGAILAEELFIRLHPDGRPDWHNYFLMAMLIALIGLMWQRMLMLIVARHEAEEEQRELLDDQRDARVQ